MPQSPPPARPPDNGPLDPGRQMVAIGSSAGGLEALQDLLGSLTPSGRVSYVVAQHLSPEHRSLIVELLSRATGLSVVQAVDGARLEPDVVAVAPPNHDVTVVGDRLKVVESKGRFGPSPSIDLLFESVAEQWGSRGVAVVLSGTGSDGAHGLRSVRAAGGLTVVQAPESAKFDGMPKAAIALGGADLVLDAREIGQRLAALVASGGDWVGHSLPPPKAELMQDVVGRLKRVVGVDFSRYKPSTLRRQVQRRMAIRQVSGVEDYLPLLAADTDEAVALAHNLLVNVTAFFRDPEAFAALADQLRPYIANKGNSEQYRVWVPGCATGEEVYTIAMIFSELLDHPVHLAHQLKIFGTDLDEGSLVIARRGLYPLVAAQAIPPQLRQRFFSEGSQGIEIQEAIRECAVFARHNVTEDPPFPRLDLISCRNTLIYFTAPLQEQVLALFRYGLLPGGLLMLGSSELLGNRTPGFASSDQEHRLYSRSAEDLRISLPSISGPSGRGGLSATLVPPLPAASRIAIIRDSVPEQHTALLEALVRTVCAPCLVLDENHNLVEVVGDVSAYCRVPEGRITTAAGSFLRPELQVEARTLFLIARADGVPIQSRALALPALERPIRLEARPLRVGDRELTILSFLVEPEGAGAPDTATGGVAAGGQPVRLLEKDASFGREIERLERELLTSQDCLRRSLAELEAANEELEASSEELQASSEELQSSNEELEAANEELQATNEELGILNAELRQHSEEQQLLNNDLENIQASLNQGMVIVDQELRITRYSPLAVRIFALVKGDIGQPLIGIPTTLPLPGLQPSLESVLAGGPRVAIEASGESGAYLVQVQPYLERDGRRRGAIVTLTDVGELVRLRTAAEAALAEFTNLTNALEEAVWKRDGAMQRLLYASARMASLTGWSAAELQDQPGLLDGRIDPVDRERVRAARESGQPRWAVRYRLQRRDDQWLWLNEVATVVGQGKERSVVGTLADVSPLQAAEAQARDMASIFESVFRTQVFGVAVLNGQGRVVMANGAFCELVGFSAESVVGLSLELLQEPVGPAPGPGGTVAPPPPPGSQADPPLRDGLCEMQLRSHNGRLVWVTAETHMLPQPIGETVALLVVQDVTALRESTQQLERQARLDASTGLFNRSSFTDTLQREISRCQREQSQLALAWIDLDHFKEVNDQYGHDAGDVVLQTISDRLQQVVRGQDCVGRLGGDEFGIVVSGYDGMGELESMLERVMAMLRQPIAIAGAEVLVGGSVGISLYPDDAGELEGLMGTSDAAMYAVKAAGGDAFAYFTPQMNAAAEERRQMHQQIAVAISAGQFELHYQPILSVADGQVWGVEALLRWRRDGASVAAGDFIVFAEESGLVRQFSPLVLGLLRADLARLKASGADALRVSVNLSVRQLQDPDLANQLAPGSEPSALAGLVLEARESVFLPEHAHALATLQRLGRQGAETCIDDYGMGYSNIRLLQDLQPRYVKLNHHFLQGCGGDAQGRRILRSATDMGHALGASVVIEGIETAAQRELAAEVKADLIQGYLLAEPMPIEQLLAWLAERPCS